MTDVEKIMALHSMGERTFQKARRRGFLKDSHKNNNHWKSRHV